MTIDRYVLFSFIYKQYILLSYEETELRNVLWNPLMIKIVGQIDWEGDGWVDRWSDSLMTKW